MIRSSACPLRQADQLPAPSGKHGDRRSYTTPWDVILRNGCRRSPSLFKLPWHSGASALCVRAPTICCRSRCRLISLFEQGDRHARSNHFAGLIADPRIAKVRDTLDISPPSCTLTTMPLAPQAANDNADFVLQMPSSVNERCLVARVRELPSLKASRGRGDLIISPGSI